MDAPMIISIVIFVIAYVFIVMEKIDRTVIAMTGAALMILTRTVSQEEAFLHIDYGTLALLISMMVIVMITKDSGVFQYLAVKVAKLAKADPIKIMIYLSIITGILSALLDNVTTILLILPVTFTLAKELGINPVPLVIVEIFASNVGGTATLIGDPPNIMIGGAVGKTFMDFIIHTAPIAIPLLVLTTFIFVPIFRKHLKTTEEAKARVMAMDEKACIVDAKLMKQSLVVLALTMLGFLLHGALHYESATIAIAGAVLLALITRKNVEHVLEQVEWRTILFFAGLFIMVSALQATGVISMLAEWVIDVTNGDLVLTALAILWVSAIASAFIDNIPFVATMIPIIKDVGALTGMPLDPLWWSLSLGACLGGNGTIVGASANVIAVGLADREGHHVTFGTFFKFAFPIMLITVAIATVYVFFRYLT